MSPDTGAFATMDAAEFKARFGDTPLIRAKRARLQRNATIMIHNANTAGS